MNGRRDRIRATGSAFRDGTAEWSGRGFFSWPQFLAKAMRKTDPRIGTREANKIWRIQTPEGQAREERQAAHTK
jgi:hypothetical protein